MEKLAIMAASELLSFAGVDSFHSVLSSVSAHDAQTLPVDVMRRRSAASGMAIVQSLVAMGLVIIAGLASVEALVLTNRKAATMRTGNNARAIVQRNIDVVLGVPFNANNVPVVLNLTSSSGSLYDEDGDGNNLVAVVVQRNGTSSVVNGTLTRIVTAQANGVGADIRRITFRVDYTYRSRSYSCEMTTLRSKD